MSSILNYRDQIAMLFREMQKVNDFLPISDDPANACFTITYDENGQIARIQGTDFTGFSDIKQTILKRMPILLESGKVGNLNDFMLGLRAIGEHISAITKLCVEDASAAYQEKDFDSLKMLQTNMESLLKRVRKCHLFLRSVLDEYKKIHGNVSEIFNLRRRVDDVDAEGDLLQLRLDGIAKMMR